MSIFLFNLTHILGFLPTSYGKMSKFGYTENFFLYWECNQTVVPRSQIFWVSIINMEKASVFSWFYYNILSRWNRLGALIHCLSSLPNLWSLYNQISGSLIYRLSVHVGQVIF